MFQSLDLPHEISKREFDKKEPKLRGDLIDAQFELLESADFPVIVLLAGVDVLGRSAAAKQLMGWMDPRHIRPYAALRQSDEESERPRMWRFWRALPRKGRVGIFLSTWYDGAASDFFMGRTDRIQFRDRIAEISDLERLLAREGALFCKFWFYRPKAQELEGLKKLKKGRAAAWKISKQEYDLAKAITERYEEAMEIFEELLAKTSSGHAPWFPLASSDPRYRDHTIGRRLVDAIGKRLQQSAPELPTAEPGAENVAKAPNILNSLDLSQSLTKEDYKARLQKAQKKITSLTLKKKFEERSLVAVFEGNDAAGKGGSIRRVVQALDPRMTRVISIAAPNDEEKAQPYLWRFWRHVPAKGNITIFDRSWYGRVLVERVERFAAEKDWMRAYEEIRSFESQMAEHGAVVVKFWLSIDKEEQLARFEQREKVGYKRHKITEEDWRNREKWDAYAQAVHDMVDRTGTSSAPWHLIEANDKYFARVKVLETLGDRLEDAL